MIKEFAIGQEVHVKATIRDELNRLVNPSFQRVTVYDKEKKLFETTLPKKLAVGIFEVSFVVPEHAKLGTGSIVWEAIFDSTGALFDYPVVFTAERATAPAKLEAKVNLAKFELRFIGTKGEIEEKPRRRKRYSSFVITYKGKRYMFEFGADKTVKDLLTIKPDYIIISHAHPDHSYGLLKVNPYEHLPNVTIYMSDDTFDILTKKRNFKPPKDKIKILPRVGWIGDILVRTIDTPHSVKAPAVAFRIKLGEKTIFYSADAAYLSWRSLRNVWLYIGDGSYLKKGNIRRLKTGELIGHAPVRTQLRWLKKAGVKQAVFTHFGKWIIGKNLRAVFMKLSKEFDINVHAAHDGRTFNLARARLGRVLPARFLVEPHAQLIFREKDPKTLIVSTIEDKKYLKQHVYVVDKRHVYGIIRIDKVLGPYDADFVRYKLRARHKITDDEWEDWAKKYPGWKKKVYITEFTVIKKFDKPYDYEHPPGAQRWVKAVEVPSEAEVTPPRRVQHAKPVAILLDEDNIGGYTTPFNKAKYIMIFDSGSFKFTFFKNKTKTIRGLAEALVRRVKTVIVKSLSDFAREYLESRGVTVFTRSGQAGYVLEKTKVIPPIIEWKDRQLEMWLKQLNEKQLRHWYSKLYAWQKLIRQKRTTKIDQKELNRRMKFVLREYRRRGWIPPQVRLEELAPVAPSGVEVGEEITLEEAMKALSKPFYLKKPFIYVMGGVVTRGKTKGDIDILIAHPRRIVERDRPVEFRLGRAASAFDKKFDGRLTFNYGEYGGPFTSHVPLYDLLVVPSFYRKVVKMEALQRFFEEQIALEAVKDPEAERQYRQARRTDRIEALQFVLPAKPAIGRLPGERYSLEGIAALIPEDAYPVSVEKKYDGVLLVIMKKGDEIVIRTDTGLEVTERLPGTVAEMRAWKQPRDVTLLSDTERWVKGEYVGRELVAAYLKPGKIKPKTPVDDKGIMHNVFDVIYFYDPKMKKHDLNLQVGDLHKEPLHLRRAYLDVIPFKQSTIDVPRTDTFFNKVPLLIAKNDKELIKLIKKASAAPASEGAVIKSLNWKAHFPLAGAAYSWWKYKKTAVIHAIVLKVLPTKTPGIYRYRVGVTIPAGWKVKRTGRVGEKLYMDIGKTMNLKKRLRPGTIVEVDFEELFYYFDPETKTRQLAIYVPMIVGIRKEQTIPDSAEEAVMIAQRAKVLRKKKGML